MSDLRENLGLWNDQSEPDYYILFLKKWIPFNAWYVSEYPTLKKKDTDIIKEIQDGNDSKPRKIIENFLKEISEHDSLKFHSYLAELHYCLERIPVVHNNNRLQFTNLSLTINPIKFKNFIDKNGNVYKAEKATSHYQAYIEAKGGKVLLDFKKPTYEPEELLKDTDFIRLDKKIKEKIIFLFNEINPKKPITVISKSTKKHDFITLKSKHSCKVINDVETIGKGCIKILYALRCMLFHGEIAPNNTNRIIYKNSFHLLELINQKLF